MITHLPPDIEVNDEILCALCRVVLTVDKAAIGLLKANKTPAFACISHFWEVELLIVGWADFLARERREYKRLHDNPMDLMYANGGNNAWLDS